MSEVKQNYRIEPCPQLFLLNPATGELPKNYKKLLEKKTLINEQQNAVDTLATNCNKLKFMDDFPHLLKALNDEYLKSAEKSKAQSNTVPARNIHKPNVGNIKRIGAVNPPAGITLKTSGRKHSVNSSKPNKGLRKALFTDRTNTNFSKRPSRVNEKKKQPKCDETLPLIDISDAELRFLAPKTKLKLPVASAIPQSKKTLIRKKKFDEKLLASSVKAEADSSSPSSLTDFLAYEQQCKTPAKKDDSSLSLNLRLENIAIKLEQQQRLFTEYKNKIDRNMADIRNDVNIILKELNINSSDFTIKNVHNTKREKRNEDFTDVPSNNSPKPAANEKDLRAHILEKCHKKKVLFDVTNNENSEIPCAAMKKNGPTSTLTMQTPNTMVRSLSKIAEQQYLSLRETPKIRH